MDAFTTQLRYILKATPKWLQDFAQSVSSGKVEIVFYVFQRSEGTVWVQLQFSPPTGDPIRFTLTFPLVETMNVVPAQVLLALPADFSAFIATCLEESLKMRTQGVM
jgi:hypothetical protein